MRHITISLLLALGVLCLLPRTGQAQTDKTVYRFLNIPVSARAAALGGNHISLFDGDVSLITANPAYLTPSSHRQMALSYVNHLADINFGQVSGAYERKGLGMLGASIRYINYGNIERTNAEGQRLGKLAANDLALDLAISRTEGEHLRYGIAAQFIYSNYDVVQSSAAAVTLGAIYSIPSYGLNVAAAVHNLGTQLSTYEGIREDLPLDISLGVTKELEHLPLRLSLLLRQLNQWDLKSPGDNGPVDTGEKLMRHVVLGGEFLLSDNVFFRLGYNYRQHQELKTRNRLDMAGLGIGLGIRFNTYRIDISRTSYSQLGGLFQLSFQAQL